MMKLEINRIHSYYGKSHVLEGVSLEVNPGELVTLLGRNGAGKTTTLRSIVGIVRPAEGSIVFDGEELIGKEVFEIARLGVSLVPEHRGIFGLLSVEENLAIALRASSRWSLSDVYEMFPRLYERRKNGGNALSGGEQQMLAIARALVNDPKLLLLDEPTEGLAPVIVDEIVRILGKIREAGVSVLLVEQNLAVCEKLADRHYVIEQGQVVYSGTGEQFRQEQAVKDRYLAV
ncbi:ABC transporter ATP-binding protein [Marinobacterium litorale]|uniref:ABC transporter ATP-binding protein n=1 Tax=Marinobacterium litorale TaxID=404770 RepID=UPI00041AF39E|nr:ABC transporter ATP-binding protein [Marinobacterium litorale]